MTDSPLPTTVRVAEWPTPQGFADGMSGRGRLVVTAGIIGWNPATGLFETDVMLARHRDAELMGVTLRHFDMHLIRGAGAADRRKDRGGSHAYRAAVQCLREGRSVAMTADVPGGEARVSVFDRGFLYGDSVYETLRSYEGRCFRLDSHLSRLQRSADLLGMRMPVPLEQLSAEVDATVAAANAPECAVRIVITRGEGPMGIDPRSFQTSAAV